MINFIENTCDIKKYNVDKNAENVVSTFTNNSMLNLNNIIHQAENPIENNLEENNMETINEEKDEILDLLFKHYTDRSKKLKDFLPRPSTSQRKRKKFTENTCFAISSLEWKLKEEKKNSKNKKLKNIKKKLEELSCLKRKKFAQKEKETKQLTKLQI